jgi:hypothetical protein
MSISKNSKIGAYYTGLIVEHKIIMALKADENLYKENKFTR